MDAARAAEMTHRECNPSFNRRWTGPPPKRNNPGRDPGVVIGKLKLNSESAFGTPERSAQRAIEAALRHAARMDRLADRLLQLGYHEPAERLSHRAQELREAVA